MLQRECSESLQAFKCMWELKEVPLLQPRGQDTLTDDLISLPDALAVLWTGSAIVVGQVAGLVAM